MRTFTQGRTSKFVVLRLNLILFLSLRAEMRRSRRTRVRKRARSRSEPGGPDRPMRFTGDRKGKTHCDRIERVSGRSSLSDRRLSFPSRINKTVHRRAEQQNQPTKLPNSSATGPLHPSLQSIAPSRSGAISSIVLPVAPQL